MLEVEFKASLAGIAEAALEAAWTMLGFLSESTVREVDVYYQGIDRDFQRTDEALRLRRVERESGSENLLTYKGPKIDPISCARRELEVALADGETTGALLEALGFHPVFTVDKIRHTLRLGDVTLCLDQVKDLGLFLELEMLVEGDSEREAAERRLLSILEALGIEKTRLTRSSYLELLQEERTRNIK